MYTHTHSHVHTLTSTICQHQKKIFLKVAEGVVPSNTMRNNMWAETTFMKWHKKETVYFLLLANK